MVDTNSLHAFLQQHYPGYTHILGLTPFTSGYSNLTYTLTTNLGSVVLRRPPHGPRTGAAHDVVREYKVLQAVKEVFNKAPQPLLLCEDEQVLGAPFYLMELVSGSIIRSQSSGATLKLAPATRTQACTALITTLAQLHALPIASNALAQLGKPTGYIHRQVEGWATRFAKAKTDNVSDVHGVLSYLRQHMPPDDHTGALIHNDYKFDNIVFDSDDYSRIVAVLDWEMTTVGHPLMDLGLTLAYWAHPEEVVEMPFLGVNATHLPGCLRRTQLVSYYAQQRGQPVEDILYYYVFGNFKIAGIIQQIYARFRAGHADDPRFAQLDQVVNYLIARAERALASGTIE